MYLLFVTSGSKLASWLLMAMNSHWNLLYLSVAVITITLKWSTAVVTGRTPSHVQVRGQAVLVMVYPSAGLSKHTTNQISDMPNNCKGSFLGHFQLGWANISIVQSFSNIELSVLSTSSIFSFALPSLM